MRTNKKRKEAAKKWVCCPSVTDKEARCSASEAILRIEEAGEGKVILHLADGWEDILPQKGEDDPGSLMMWDDANIDATVVAFNIALMAVPPAVWPHWLNHAGALSSSSLKADILSYVQMLSGGGGVVGNCVITPNTLDQYVRCCTSFGYIGTDPFFIAHAVSPIGRHYVLADRRAQTTAVAAPILAPPFGVSVFA